MKKSHNNPDQIDNNLQTAYEIESLKNDEKFEVEEFVGESDEKDFYKFQVEEQTNINIELGGLSGNADLYLLNNQGQVIEKSTKDGESVEDIKWTFDPGAYYYVEVQSKGKEDVNYTLSLDVALGSQQEDKVGNNWEKAYNFGALKNDEEFEEFVGESDEIDFYKFQVEEQTDVNIKLGGLSGNADLYLLNNQGQVIEESIKEEDSLEDIERTLNPGAYYVKVQSNGKENANYTLSLNVASGSQQPNASDTSSLDVDSGSENLKKYEFTYYYSGSQDYEFQDYYNGYFYAPEGTYEVDSYYDFNEEKNQASANGKYYISSSSEAGAKAKDGEVYLESYYDLETNKKYVPYYTSEDLPSGASGIGSEQDFIDFEKDEDVIELKREGFFGADYYLADIVKEARTSKSGDYQIDALLSPYKWGTNTITYSFYDNDSGPYYGAQRDVGEVSDKVQEDIRHILENIYEPLSDLDFVEVADTSNSYGLIRIMKSSNPNYAYAYYPYADDYNAGNLLDLAGDVHLNVEYDGNGGYGDHNNFQRGPGSHGYMTLIHELGHAVGLKHPHEDGDTLPEDEDNTSNTVMSYNFTYTADNLRSYDVNALQYIYGFETPEDSVTVKSPNGGDTLKLGKSYTITWDDNFSENVKLELYKGGSFDSIITNSTASDGSYGWTLPTSMAIGSDYKVKITSVSDAGVSDFSDSNFTIEPDYLITVKSPNGGDVINTGDTYNITWDDNISENVRIHLYQGNEFKEIITNSTASDGSYIWTLPTSLPTGDNYKVAIQSVVKDNLFDYSDSNFTIEPDGVITVKSPNGGDVLKTGDNYDITWDDNIRENVRLELYKDGSFDRTIANSTGSDGSYNWMVPTSIASGGDYQVKITSVSNVSVSDLSDSNFTIEPNFITVKSPNGGDVINTGDTYNISWDDNISENVRIHLYQGNEFKEIITNSTASDGSYIWTLPTSLPTGDNYKVAIQSVVKDNLFDYSDSNFTIEPDGVITVKSPNGGDVLKTGDNYDITWDDNIRENVRLELYKDGSFDRTIANSTGSDGSYNWMVPTSIASGGDYQVKITSVSDVSVSDLSDSNFTIEPNSFITVTSPNGGDILNTGDTYNITWDDNIGENVRIYLFQGNRYMQMISRSTPSDGSYSWKVPTNLTTGGNYKVAIQSVEKGSIYDYSDSKFTIEPDEPDDFITVMSPNGGDILNTGDTYNITWDDNIGENVRIYLFQGNRYMQMISRSTPSDGSYSWKVPTNLTTGGNYKVAIQSVVQGSLYDFSNRNFSIKTEDVSPDKYYFTYYYNVGDSYSGFLYEKPGTYSSDDILNVASGYYQIEDIESGVGNKDDIGHVYIYSYYDGNYTGNTYEPFFFSRYEWRSGQNGLGSEGDYLGFPFYQRFDSNNEFNGLM